MAEPKRSYLFLIYTLLSLISGLFLAFSYPKHSLWLLGWISLIPVFFVTYKTKNLFKMLFFTAVFAITFHLISLYWIYFTMRVGKVPEGISLIGLIALAVTLSMEQIIVFLIAFPFKKFKAFAFALVISSTWILFEFLKINSGRIFAWFPWFSLSYTQNNNPYIQYLTNFGTGHLITFMLVFFNSFTAAELAENAKKNFLKPVFLSIILIIGLFLSSNTGKNIPYEEENTLSVTLIQPSVDLYKKWDSAYENEIKSRLESLLAETKNSELIIWPENALYGWIDDPAVFEWLSKEIKKTKAWHIVGSVSRIDGKHVSAFLINPEGEIKQEYHKRVLVPFGEYVPFRALLKDKIEAIGALGEFEKGPENQPLFEVKGFKIGMTICYETVFDYLYRQQARDGADFFVNITNDGWFLNTWAPYQHIAAAQTRAKENSLFMARAANNGVSAFINAKGEIVSQMKLNDIGVLKFQIHKKINSGKNSDLNGVWIIYLSAIILLSFFAAKIFI